MTAQFQAIGMVVSDMAKALAFYRKLGLDIPSDADTAPHAEASLPGGVRLMWDTVETVKSFDSDWSPPTGGHAMGLAFRCDSPADVDRQYADVVEAGYEGHKEPWDAAWGMRYAMVRDPDGNPVDFFADLPS